MDEKPKKELTPGRIRSNQNLHIFTSDNQDHDQCVANGRKAGLISAEKRRRKKRLQEAAKWLLMQNDVISNTDVKKKMFELGITDATNAEALMMIALKKASAGNVEAMKYVRDTAGEAPSNRVELAGDVDRPIATLDLRAMSEEELLRMAEARDPEAAEE